MNSCGFIRLRPRCAVTGRARKCCRPASARWRSARSSRWGLRHAAGFFRRPQHRHLLLGLSVRAGRESGSAVVGLPEKADVRRRISRVVAHLSRKTDFGFEQIPEADKARRVGAVFDRVAERYDLMNDLMSLGLHRVWKAFAVAIVRPRPGERMLDVATGSGDLALSLAGKVLPGGEVWLSDVNGRMLQRGRDRAIDRGLLAPAVQCDAERLPFPEGYFDCVTVAFGLRNMTHKDAALAEMARVLKRGGRLIVLEFSRVWKPLAPAYELYSFRVL